MCSVDDIGIEGVLEADGSTLDSSNWGVGDISLNPADFEAIWNPIETLKWTVEQLIDLPDAPEQIKGVLVTKTGNTLPLPVVYGARRVGGSRVFLATTGNSNEYLHMVLACCEGVVESIDSIWINDDEVLETDIDATGNVTAGKFSGLLRIKKYLGTDSQIADSDLVADVTEWTTAHKLSGVAYVYLRCLWSQDNRAFGSFPRVRIDVRGSMIYDPRTTFLNFSNNPALCLYDYLTNTRYGRGLAAADIDVQSFIDAANYCDEQIIPHSGATYTINRYACDGVINTGNELLDNIKQLLSCMRGWLPYVSGKWALLLDKPETPAFTFDESNIVGELSVSRGGKSSRLNHVTASYANPAEDYQPDVVVMDSAIFRAEDNGLLLEKRMGLTFTDSPYRAANLAELAMKQSRQGLSASFNATLAALEVSVGQVCGVSHASLGWVDKPFRVSSIQLMANATVSVSMTEYESTVYNLSLPTAAPVPPNTNLPDPSSVLPPSGLQLFSGTGELILAGDGSIVSRVRARWTPTQDVFVDGYDVEYRMGTNPPVLMEEKFDASVGDTLVANCTISIDNGRLKQEQNPPYDITNVYWPLSVTPGQKITVSVGFDPANTSTSGKLSVGTGIIGSFRNDLSETGTLSSPTNFVITTTPTTDTIYIFGWAFGSNAIAFWDNLSVVIGPGGPIEIPYLPSANPRGALADTAYIIGAKDGDLVDVRVRAVNTNGVPSSWVEQLGHTVIGKTAPPPDVDTFFVRRLSDGTREFRWAATRPVDFGGYEVRYKLGAGYSWSDMTPLHDGLLPASPYETNQLAAGTYTAGIKMFDTSGNESANAKIIVSTLGDPRIGGSIGSVDMRAAGWPGTKTNCWVDNDGSLNATDTKTWADLGADGITWATWKTWARAPSSTMVYEHPVIDVGVVTPFMPLVSVIANGAVTIDEIHSDDNISYTSWAEIGQQITARYIKIRVTVAVVNTPNLARITQSVVILGADPTEEVLEDLDTSTLTGPNRVGVGDIRLPVTKPYSVIKKVNLALQNVGAGWTWDQIDKNISIGPRIKIYNASGVLADATIDAEIKGV